MFKLKFDTGNAAFDGDYRGAEIARILTETARHIEENTVAGEVTGGTIHDVNGNRVGSWSLE